MNGIPESQMSEFAPDVIALIGTGAAKVIPLTQGKVAVVDAEDYEWLNRWKWHSRRSTNTFYAVRNVKVPQRRTIWMHREILNLMPGSSDRRIIDHRDRNGLNNKRGNLRIVDAAVNQYNRFPQKNNTSGYIGVFRNKTNKTWTAQIRVKGRLKYFGSFYDPVAAAHAYDRAAKKHRGSDAVLNFPEET